MIYAQRIKDLQLWRQHKQMDLGILHRYRERCYQQRLLYKLVQTFSGSQARLPAFPLSIRFNRGIHGKQNSPKQGRKRSFLCGNEIELI